MNIQEIENTDTSLTTEWYSGVLQLNLYQHLLNNTVDIFELKIAQWLSTMVVENNPFVQWSMW